MCPAGRLCAGTAWTAAARAEPQECGRGYYCPAKTAATTPVNEETICAPGSFSYNINLMSQDECIPCAIGKYCQATEILNQVTVSTWDGEVCLAGFYCPMGSAFAMGTDE